MKPRAPHTAPPRASIAPVHRGAQAHPAPISHPGAALITTATHHAPNAALLIDFDNVTMGIRSDLGHELRNLLGSEIIRGKVAVQRAYADWRRYPQYIVPLAESSIDMIMAPAYGSSKKNATDIRLAIDAMELVFTRPEIGTFILLSGDSDFSSLVMKIKEYGKYVIGVGIRESSSDLLVQNCDEYYSYNALAGLVKTGEEDPSTKWDPWELAAEAVGRMQANGDVMRSDRLKQVMQEIDATFDEKNVGMSKFSRFCMEAAAKGYLKATKLDNGQLEVAPADAGTKPTRGARPAAAAPAPAAPRREKDESAAGEGRSRRGRRGGRGRKRSDAAEAPAHDTPIAGTVEEAPSHAAPANVAATAAPRPSHAETDGIGASGLRLTRDEAFALVRDAVAAVAADGNSVPGETVRQRAFQLLGRDSESLSARNFARILRDAHDADLIDLRRRGDDFEVSMAASVPSVAAQLEEKEAQVIAAEPPKVVPVAPRGMGPRSAPGRGRASTGAKTPAPELFLVGVVDDPEDAPSPRPRRPRRAPADKPADDSEE